MFDFFKNLFFPEPDTDILVGKVYNFEVGDLSFGPLDQETLHTIFKDGRASSKLIENCLVSWFPELKLATTNNRGFDHYWGTRKVEVKGFTKSGCTFLPSHMIGKGRIADPQKAFDELTADTLCMVDITDFPKVSVRFVDHFWAYNKFPKGRISPRERDYFFKRNR